MAHNPISPQTTLSQYSNYGGTSGDLVPEGELADVDWAFKGATTDYLTHGLVSYPARMVPQIPATLLSHYRNSGVIQAGDTLYDPFCGSGTSLVEARLHGLNGIGTDLNPFACYLSRTKAVPIEIDPIWNCYHSVFGDWHIFRRFVRDTYQTRVERVGYSPIVDVDEHDGTQQTLSSRSWPSPQTEKVDFSTVPEEEIPSNPADVQPGWFPQPQRSLIEGLKRRLSEARSSYNYKTVRFHRLILGMAARKISYQKPGEFKRQRMSEAERKDHHPDVFNTYNRVFTKWEQRMDELTDSASPSPETTVYLHDNRDPELLDANSVDIVISSPPYGDHSTTVGYGQYSTTPMLAATPFDWEQMTEVDNTALGGPTSPDSFSVTELQSVSPTLERTVDAVRDQNPDRGDDAFDFFTDYAASLTQIGRVIKPEQPVALVVGNRTMADVPIPMHEITIDIADSLGFEHNESLPRDIPTKTIPFETSPSNVAGETTHTIADEYILLFDGVDDISRINA
jgi:site-specific DNA-methyltransferase (cytosine-N4-specific)